MDSFWPFRKRFILKKAYKDYVSKGMTLMELTVSIGILTVLIMVIGSFTSNTPYTNIKNRKNPLKTVPKHYTLHRYSMPSASSRR